MSTRYKSPVATEDGTRPARRDSKSPRRRTLVLWLGVLACVLSWLAAGCARPGGQSGASITLAGSTSVQPFAEMLAEEYAKEFPDRPAVNVQGGGSSAGARAALTGAAQIGMMSRDLAASENELVPVVMAKDAIVLVVHPSNPVQGLSKEQVKDIYSGRIVSWDQVGGHPSPIHVVSREEGSGTRGAFDELVMEGGVVVPRAVVQDSNGAVRETVAGDKAGIGYISLGLVDQSVKALSIDGVAPTLENAQEGKYTLVRPFLLVHKGTLPSDAQHFVDYVTGAEGQSILAGEGLVTVK
ncbi:MAG: phosphate ABC transporter substrate-binding protein [Bacillota bacterium]